jgi:hypothetical protein
VLDLDYERNKPLDEQGVLDLDESRECTSEFQQQLASNEQEQDPEFQESQQARV